MKKNIAIIMGGYSSEIDISLKSGKVVCQNLNKEKYTPYQVHILKEKWVVVDENQCEYPINKHDFSVAINDHIITFDCVFNAIHGAPGEDGRIIAYFELLGIKNTSAPFFPMALSFNKRECLSTVKQYGVKTADSYYLNQGEEIDTEAIIEKVGLPCFVKPNKAGSSFGISKVKSSDDLIPAIEKAFIEDAEIIIESFLDGPEITIGVIEYQNETIVLPLTEIITSNDFFDYSAKYEGESDEITPANVSVELKEKLEMLAKKVYRILNMKGFSRSEFIVVNGEPHFLELNSVPGLTAMSIVPQQAEKAGISLEKLFENAIEMALKHK